MVAGSSSVTRPTMDWVTLEMDLLLQDLSLEKLASSLTMRSHFALFSREITVFNHWLFMLSTSPLFLAGNLFTVTTMTDSSLYD